MQEFFLIQVQHLRMIFQFLGCTNKIDLTWKKHRSWSSPYELLSNFGGLSDESADKPLWIPWINWQEVAYLLDDFSLINFCCFVSHRPHFPLKSAASPSRTVWVSGHRHMSCKASDIHGGSSSPGYHKCLPVWQMAVVLIKVIRNYTLRIFSSTTEGFYPVTLYSGLTGVDCSVVCLFK